MRSASPYRVLPFRPRVSAEEARALHVLRRSAMWRERMLRLRVPLLLALFVATAAVIAVAWTRPRAAPPKRARAVAPLDVSACASPECVRARRQYMVDLESRSGILVAR